MGSDRALRDDLRQLVGSQGRQRVLGVELPGSYSLQAAEGTVLSVPVAPTAGLAAQCSAGQGQLMTASSLLFTFTLLF